MAVNFKPEVRSAILYQYQEIRHPLTGVQTYRLGCDGQVKPARHWIKTEVYNHLVWIPLCPLQCQVRSLAKVLSMNDSTFKYAITLR